MGGVDSDTYGGDLVKSAKAVVPGLTAVSPNYGFPQNGKVGDPGFRFYPDKQMVDEAHANGLKVIPWTCDDNATIEALMDMGMAGIITNYPTMSATSWLSAACDCPTPIPHPDRWRVEAGHLGWRCRAFRLEWVRTSDLFRVQDSKAIRGRPRASV